MFVPQGVGCMASEEAERDVAAAELAAAVAAAWEEGGLAALLGDSQPPSALTRCVGVTPGVRKVPCRSGARVLCSGAVSTS